jgi:hypothetical protein
VTVLAGLPAATSDKVSPGFAGFLAVFVLAVATVLLIRSMVGHLRKVRYSPGPEGEPAPQAPPQEAQAPDPAGGSAPARAQGKPEGTRGESQKSTRGEPEGTPGEGRPAKG